MFVDGIGGVTCQIQLWYIMQCSCTARKSSQASSDCAFWQAATVVSRAVT
jgi:hypothetical protein